MILATLSAAFWLIAAAALHGALSERLAVGWGRPDFLLVAAVLLSINRSSDAAAVTGFFAGLLHAALQNDKMMALTISRTLACAISVRLYLAFLGAGVATTLAVVLVASLIASIVYLFLGVPENILAWAKDTIGAAIYNTALAVPGYWVHSKLTRRQAAAP